MTHARVYLYLRALSLFSICLNLNIVYVYLKTHGFFAS